MDALKAKIEACTRCELCKNLIDGHKPLMGLGQQTAKVFLIKERLLKNEGFLNEVINATHHRFLVSLFQEYGFQHTDLYITNWIKCPTDAVSTQGLLECKLWLLEELEKIKPTIVVTFGKIVKGRYDSWMPDDYIHIELPAISKLMSMGKLRLEQHMKKLRGISELLYRK